MKKLASKGKKRKTKEENMTIIKKITLKLLEKEGYRNTSVNKIAETSGINVSQLYRYFPGGKPEILLAIGKDMGDTMLKRTDVSKIEDPKDFLKLILLTMVKIHQEKQVILRSMKIAFLSNPEIFEEDRRGLSGAENTILPFKDIFLQLGLSDEEQIQEFSKSIFHLIDAAIERHILVEKIAETDEKFANFITDLIVGYIERKGKSS